MTNGATYASLRTTSASQPGTFQALQHTNLRRYDLTPWTQNNDLLVTRDFVETVETIHAEDQDWYVKAVKWVAYSIYDGQ
ncbi:uncharacterized protein PV06_10539 [Exophiala oligosperma]|uniref:Uncharacterized protein n=1 Tax=Exophiala oligosperma TaxID=215243 RepID=A0A0D2AB07_9EURO|nr:uncharacterized protein PV06_10539 [Exophiala oligosperma]KIW37501.1 hypothetical protein PV06_10539 [Exophiala oligosperma]